MRGREGWSLLEAVVVMAILGIVTVITVPAILSGSAEIRTRMAAAELVGVLRQARSLAVRHNVNVGVKFFVGAGRPEFGIYRDGDGDGVSTRDIEDGTDPPMVRPRALQHVGAHAGFGFPPGPPPRDPGRPGRYLTRLDDPIRFNRSDMASFSPLGSSTPGSLYLTDGARTLVVVRLLGATGRARTLSYDRDEEVWR